MGRTSLPDRTGRPGHYPAMSTTTMPELRPPEQIVDPSLDPAEQPGHSALSRRGFLRGAAVAGGGIVAATIAACAPAAAPAWTYGPTVTQPPAGASPAPGTSAAASPPPSAAASPAASPAGATPT